MEPGVLASFALSKDRILRLWDVAPLQEKHSRFLAIGKADLEQEQSLCPDSPVSSSGELGQAQIWQGPSSWGEGWIPRERIHV